MSDLHPDALFIIYHCLPYEVFSQDFPMCQHYALSMVSNNPDVLLLFHPAHHSSPPPKKSRIRMLVILLMLHKTEQISLQICTAMIVRQKYKYDFAKILTCSFDEAHAITSCRFNYKTILVTYVDGSMLYCQVKICTIRSVEKKCGSVILNTRNQICSVLSNRRYTNWVSVLSNCNKTQET